MPNGFLGAHVVDIARPHAILVDQTGQRFCNESGSYMETGQKQYERHRQVPAVPAWLVIDDTNRRNYPLFVTMPGRTPQEKHSEKFSPPKRTWRDVASCASSTGTGSGTSSSGAPGRASATSASPSRRSSRSPSLSTRSGRSSGGGRRNVTSAGPPTKAASRPAV